MSKSKNTDKSAQRDTSTQAFDAADQGRVNTQQNDGGPLRADKNNRDQSEGSREDGQATARHGQGAGFSRNTH